MKKSASISADAGTNTPLQIVAFPLQPWCYRSPMFALAMWLAIVAGAPRGTFTTSVRPILERRCQPCHFTGGKMYERLPFDLPGTILRLGTKLCTRIKDQKDREVIRKFLSSKH